MCLKFMKLFKYLKFVFKQINPRELAKVIKKANIVAMISSRRGGGAPNIREHEF
jgi:hypothetical protein